MADALCGPSNALQNFQKQTSADRTLQQDRLTNRHSPAQGFRSSPAPNTGFIDAEFDAFQAGHAGPPQPNLHFHAPPGLAPQFAQAAQTPDWASDFQRLNIAPSHPPPIQRHHPPQASNAAASWHQDFARQQVPVAQAPMQQQNMFGGIPRQNMGWAGPSFQQSPGYGVMNGTPLSESAQGKQRAQEGVPQFDEAAFERAFEQAQQDAIANSRPDPLNGSEVVAEAANKQFPATDTVLKLQYAVFGSEGTAPELLADLEELESTGRLTEDATEAKWCVHNLQEMVGRGVLREQESRVERLITAINERLMSTYPLGYAKDAVPAPLEQQSEQKQDEQPSRHDDDEMAETAGKLLDKVADNSSTKFQNSQFLELMRRLRDREVRVEGDKMVEVSSAQSSTSPMPPTAATAPPPIDPMILNHSAQDFGMPVDSEPEFERRPPRID